ncbi:MAG: DNA primase small subunit PriS [Methanomassiliicoccales archaeon PtaU1.Bin124]|nr:MAG: DNA primase small subunit PriS [Methanomassiliicoccales archaeon PtaU1.Bin124]
MMKMTREMEFAMRWFGDYYSRAELPQPDRFEEREFGFMFFDKDFVRRHMGFGNMADLRHYLVRQVPMHAYYSSAFYEKPGAPKMEMKGWRGADLVFDLDADHLKGAEQMTYAEMLAAVKKDMVRLLDDFLFGDLGFAEEEVRIVFSGGRGYHAHVSNEKVRGLKSHERSEIVDYVCGTDLDKDWLFPQKATMQKVYKTGKKTVDIAVSLPEEGAGGWRGHAREVVAMLLNEMEGLEIPEIRARYPSLAPYNDKVLAGIQMDLYGSRGGGMRGKDLILERNSLEYIMDRNKEAFLRWIQEEVKIHSAAEVDEPVTRDVKRLIRMPGSLHGKTAMRVIPMGRDQLNDFDPLRDAFPPILPEHPIKVVAKNPVDIRLKGERIKGEGMMEVPTYAALFMILRMKASLA